MGDPIKSPQDMRKEMQRIAATGIVNERHPMPMSISPSIVRTVLRAGQYEGWSGEDIYTVLAWQLLQVVERQGNLLYEAAVLAPAHPMVMVKPKPPCPQG